MDGQERKRGEGAAKCRRDEYPRHRISDLCS